MNKIYISFFNFCFYFLKGLYLLIFPKAKHSPSFKSLKLPNLLHISNLVANIGRVKFIKILAETPFLQLIIFFLDIFELLFSYSPTIFIIVHIVITK